MFGITCSIKGDLWKQKDMKDQKAWAAVIMKIQEGWLDRKII